jgi:hypothetical protein
MGEMSNVHDLTPKLLTEIRDELRKSNERLERLEVGQTRQHTQSKDMLKLIDEHAVGRILDIPPDHCG